MPGKSVLAYYPKRENIRSMPVDNSADTRGIGGHPAGLTTLFLTEMWERFSYYGMRAILVLFMVAPAAQGGLCSRSQGALSATAFSRRARPSWLAVC